MPYFSKKVPPGQVVAILKELLPTKWLKYSLIIACGTFLSLEKTFAKQKATTESCLASKAGAHTTIFTPFSWSKRE